MQRILEKFLCFRDFHDIALIDYGDTVRNETDDGKVMRNEQIGNAHLFLELLHQVQNLRTDGYVQCGNRFVGDNKLRLHNHCSGKADTLSLAARELMRITGQMLRKEADLIDDLLDFGDTVRLVLVKMEIVKTFGNDIVYRCTLIERSRGILEYHLDIPDHVLIEGPRDLARNPYAFIIDFTGSTFVNADYGTSDGRLTRAGLSDEGERLTLVDIKGSVLHGFDGRISFAECDVHIFHGKQNFPTVFGHRPVFGQMLHALVVYFFSHVSALLLNVICSL